MLQDIAWCDETPVQPMTIVIVHGAWGGKHQWKSVARRLEKITNVETYRAALTGLGERTHLASPKIDLNTHIRDVVNLIELEDLSRVILIGHSYGGMVVSGVANAIPDRISGLLFLDAYLPNDGDNFFSQHPELEKKLTQRANDDGDGWRIPVDWPNPMGDVPHPLLTMTQAIKLDVQKISRIPSQYWLFTDGCPKENDQLLNYFQRAQSRGYMTKHFKWGHNPHRDQVEAFARELKKYLETMVEQ